MRFAFLLVLVVVFAVIHETESAWFRRAFRVRIRFRRPFRRLWRRITHAVRRHIVRPILKIIYKPVNGGWSNWGSWRISEACTAPCGGGLQENMRERTCNNPRPKHGGNYCNGWDTDFQTVKCNVQPCPTERPKVDGGWSRWRPWSKYSKCTKTCGGGVREKTKTRSCTNPKPSNRGRDCPGGSSISHSSRCNTQECPEPTVDGGWSAWSSWSMDTPCTKTCGGGTQDNMRERKCVNPEPKHGGKYCAGDDTQFQTVSCNQEACPTEPAKIDGGWSVWNSWSDYSSCTETCGGGVHQRTRSRSCTQPQPANGGRNCLGSSSVNQTSSCNEQRCPEDLQCPPGKNVYIAGKKCGQYVQCVNGVAHEKTCPENTIWDQDAETCNHGYWTSATSFGILVPGCITWTGLHITHQPPVMYNKK